MIENPSILIILMGSLGDVVRGLAVAVRLRRSIPGARITWLVEPKCKEAVDALPAIDEVIVFDRSHPVGGFLDLYRRLRRGVFDITLDMQRHLKSGLFSMLSGAPRRIGFARKDSKEFNWLFNNEHIPYEGTSLNKYDHYQRFVDYLGVSGNGPSPVLEGWSRGSGDEILSSLPIGVRTVGIVLGSSWKSKDWPAEYYRELIDRIARLQDTGVVLLGDGKARGLAAELAGSSERIDNRAGKTSLRELIACIRSCSVCIGPDSGPGHIASAVGTPYLALFGPTSAQRTAPAGAAAEVLDAAAACAPCYRRECPGLGQICMKSLTVDMVFDRLKQMLEDPREKH